MNEKDPQPVPFESADAECKRLREENARLRQLLLERHITIPTPVPESPTPAAIANPSTTRPQSRRGVEKELPSSGACSEDEKMFTLDGLNTQMEDRDMPLRTSGTGRPSIRAGLRIARKLNGRPGSFSR